MSMLSDEETFTKTGGVFQQELRHASHSEKEGVQAAFIAAILYGCQS